MNPRAIGAIVVTVILALAVGVAVFLFNQNEALNERNGLLEAQNQHLKSVAAANAAEVERLRQAQRATETLLAERAQLQQMLTKEFERVNKKLMEAATNDPPSRDWLTVRVPDRLTGLLREAGGVRDQGRGPQGNATGGPSR